MVAVEYSVEAPDSLAGLPQRLEALTTRWSLVRAAHADAAASRDQARAELVLRYATVIRQYVRAIVHDPGHADELAQDVIVRLLRGDFASADPARGRFRDLLKTAVRNMIRNHWAKENRRRPRPIDIEQMSDDSSHDEQLWDTGWRQQALDLAWSGLESYERLQPQSLAYTLLRFRAAHPEDSSNDLATRLSEYVGQRISAEATRQKLRRARVRFAEILVDEIADGLEHATPETIEEELQSLQLFEYVRDLLPSDWKSRHSPNRPTSGD